MKLTTKKKTVITLVLIAAGFILMNVLTYVNRIRIEIAPAAQPYKPSFLLSRKRVMDAHPNHINMVRVEMHDMGVWKPVWEAKYSDSFGLEIPDMPVVEYGEPPRCFNETITDEPIVPGKEYRFFVKDAMDTYYLRFRSTDMEGIKKLD